MLTDKSRSSACLESPGTVSNDMSHEKENTQTTPEATLNCFILFQGPPRVFRLQLVMSHSRIDRRGQGPTCYNKYTYPHLELCPWRTYLDVEVSSELPSGNAVELYSFLQDIRYWPPSKGRTSRGSHVDKKNIWDVLACHCEDRDASESDITRCLDLSAHWRPWFRSSTHARIERNLIHLI